jgi:hypothetical protein
LRKKADAFPSKLLQDTAHAVDMLLRCTISGEAVGLRFQPFPKLLQHYEQEIAVPIQNGKAACDGLQLRLMTAWGKKSYPVRLAPTFWAFSSSRLQKQKQSHFLELLTSPAHWVIFRQLP